MKLRESAASEIEEYLAQTKQGLKTVVCYVFVISFFINGLMLTAPIYMLQVFDRVILSKSIDTLIYLTIIAIGALFLYAILETLRSFIMIKSGNWLANRLNKPALSPCAEEIIQGRKYGAQSIRDINQLKQFVSSSSTFSFFDAPWTPFYLMIVFLIHPILGWISTAGSLVIIVLAILNERVSRKAITDSNSLAMHNNKRLDVAFRNVDVIRAFGMMPDLIKIWQNDDAYSSGLMASSKKWSTIISFSSRLVRFIMQILILGSAAYLVIQNELTPGMMIASSIIMSRALAPIEQLIGTWNSLVLTQQAYERLNSHFVNAVYPGDTISLPEPKGILEIENLSYAPPQTHEMLIKHINFKLMPGEILGVIGPSAAGKTTLTKLLVGILHPSIGHVHLDGAESYDWDHTELGKHIGYLPQNIELFPESISKNIARMRDAKDEAIIQAAKLAKVHELILSFPEGYDTLVGEGSPLSGGQQQRIGFARALFGNPQLIVLDEPNSNLDIQGEADLISTLKLLKKSGKTIIIVAHRTGIIQLADKLLLMDKGTMHLYGAKDEVLNKLKSLSDRTLGGTGKTT